MYHDALLTPLGWLRLVSDGSAIREIRLSDAPGPGCPDELTRQACRELEEYFAGTRRSFDLPLDPPGTAFQKRVWQTLRDVPFGRTVTYGQLAAAVGNPGAARAVGGALGQNPILILIPCHRVLAATGIGGFSAGLACKRILLALEEGEEKRENGERAAP